MSSSDRISVSTRSAEEARDESPWPRYRSALAWVLMGAWVVALGLGIEATLSGAPLPPVFIAADRDGGYPTLVGFRSGTGAEGSGLRVGDRLLRMGSRDLTGVGPLSLFVETARAGRSGEVVKVRYRRGGSAGTARLVLAPTPPLWRVVPFSVAWATLALLILLRSSWSPASRHAFGATIGIALTAPLFGGSYVATIFSAVSLSFGAGAMAVFGLLFCVSFLSKPRLGGGAAEVPRWPWLFAVAVPLEASRDFGFFLPPAIGNLAFIVTLSLSPLCGLWILTARARQASPIERRQLYWVLFGLYWGAAPIILATILTIADSRFAPLYDVAVVLAGVLPVVWGFAVIRFNMFDVDEVISSTATYSMVAVALFAVAMFVDSFLLQEAPVLVEIVLAGSLVALSVPVFRWLRPSVERFLFPERIRTRRSIELVAEKFSSYTGVDQLFEQAAIGIHSAVDPLCCAIYSVGETGPELVAHRGPAPRTTLPGDGGLIAALVDRTRSFHVQPRRDIALTFDERTDLQSLQAAVIVPIRHHDRLHSFIVIGDKHSEDIYTRRELAAFDWLSREISGTLGQFDDSLRS